VRLLYIPQLGNEEPSYGEFLTVLGSRFEHVLYDHGVPADGQFDGIDVVVDHGGHGTREMIDAGAAAGVRLWQVLTTGLDHTEVDYILERNIPLANTPGIFSSIALAEHALLLMLGFAKHLPESREHLSAGVMYSPVNTELSGRVLGLVGLGASGRELARRARAFGMRLVALDAAPISDEELAELGIETFGGPESLDALLGAADYVSLHVPLTAGTRHLIDRARIGLLKPTAVLINIARGGLVDEEALVEALVEGRLRGAGIDVYSQEPPDPESPLLHLRRVIATPHVAGMTYETLGRRAEACLANVARIADGKPPLYQVTSSS
jgi:phosphoglycerate dehydrogenase-like enzyme